MRDFENAVLLDDFQFSLSRFKRKIGYEDYYPEELGHLSILFIEIQDRVRIKPSSRLPYLSILFIEIR